MPLFSIKKASLSAMLFWLTYHFYTEALAFPVVRKVLVEDL